MGRVTYKTIRPRELTDDGLLKKSVAFRSQFRQYRVFTDPGGVTVVAGVPIPKDARKISFHEGYYETNKPEEVESLRLAKGNTANGGVDFYEITKETEDVKTLLNPKRLIDLPNVDSIKAAELVKAGVNTPYELKDFDSESIASVLGWTVEQVEELKDNI